MYVGDEQSVVTPVTFVAPRPPPRRIPPHPSVQREGMFARHLIQICAQLRVLT